MKVSEDGELKVLKFTYSLDAFNPKEKRYRFGRAENTLKVKEGIDGWKIVSENQKILEVKKR